jgi:hypothetical protein
VCRSDVPWRAEVAAGADAGSDALKLGDGPFIDDVPGIQSRFWLDQHDVRFFVSDGAMLDAARHDDEFAFLDDGFAIAKLHPQGAFDDQEEFILIFVMMPDKFSLELDSFDVAVVYFPDDARFPMIGEEAEFFLEIDRVHEFT